MTLFETEFVMQDADLPVSILRHTLQFRGHFLQSVAPCIIEHL